MLGIGLTVLGIGGPITAAICKFVPTPKPLNGNSPVSKDVCIAKHESIEKALSSLQTQIGDIHKYIMAKQRNGG